MTSMVVILAAAMIIPATAVVVWLNVAAAKARRLRRKLACELQEKLKNEDEAWFQTYNF